MFQHSHGRNLHNRGSKFRRVFQIALLLAVTVWLVNHIHKNEYAGGDQINLDEEEDVSFGRKGKAGSENVVIIDGQRNVFDETSETGDQAEAFGQHTEEKNEDESSNDEQMESHEVISNTDQAETQEEQLGNKDDTDDSGTSSRDEAIGNDTSSEKEDVLQLPRQRDSQTLLDSNEGGNVEDNSVQQNEIVTDGAKDDAGEVINSDEEKILRSMDQLDGGEKADEVEREANDSQGGVKLESESSSGVEKEEIDSHGGVILETDSRIENSSGVEKEEIDPHGGVKSETEGNNEYSLEDTTTSASSDDTSLPLPKQENEVSSDSESSEKDTLDSRGHISTDAETTEHHTSETVSSDAKTEDESVNLPTSTEEKVSMMPTNNEVPQRKAVEFQDNTNLKAEATGDNPLAEETNTKLDDKLTVTSEADDTKNVELPVTNEALERDVVESHDDNASDAGSNDVEEVKVDSKSNEDTPESNEDTPESKADDTSKAQDAGENSSLETGSEINSADEAENSSHNNENNSEVPTDEVSNVEAAESQGDKFSKDENTSSTVFEDKTDQPNPKEETASKLGNDNASYGDNNNANSLNEGGTASE